MSTAVATPTLCACGCGQPVHGRRFLNARHKERAGPPKPKVYPHYISAELRERLCARHGNVITEHSKHWESVGGQRLAGSDWMTLSDCPECKAEETARLERLEPKPSSNPCENRTCSCVPPKCPECGHPMAMGPGCLGSHSWVCNDIGLVEREDDGTGANNGITATPLVLTGTHRREQWTLWRNNAN